MNSINEIKNYFNDEIRFVFDSIDENVISKLTEIRIRKNMPISLIIKNSTYFVDYNGDIYDYPSHNSVVISSKTFEELFMKLCDYSVYSVMETMKKGYITLPSGARIGIASTCVTNDNKIISVKNVTSLNIRLSKQIKGCADKILNCLYVNSFPSIIIAGKPNSGKTTLLRDLAYQLSNGFNNHYRKVSIIDERNEIAGKINDIFSTEIGINSDVLSGFDKATGIEIATRTLSPEMIICDEISTNEELKSIEYAFSSGVAFALSIHIEHEEDLYNKEIAKSLLKSNHFSYVVLLDNYTYDIKIIDVSEVQIEADRNDNINDFINSNWCFKNANSKEKI